MLRFDRFNSKAARPRVDSYVGMVSERLDVGDDSAAGHVRHDVDDVEDAKGSKD